MTLEEKLTEIDFSRFSKVKMSLLEQINERRRMDVESELMDEEELEMVAAAGTRPVPEKNVYPLTEEKIYPPKKN